MTHTQAVRDQADGHTHRAILRIIIGHSLRVYTRVLSDIYFSQFIDRVLHPVPGNLAGEGAQVPRVERSRRILAMICKLKLA